VKPSSETNGLESEVVGDLVDVTDIIKDKERAPSASEDGVKCCCDKSKHTGRCQVVQSKEAKCKNFNPAWAEGRRLFHYTNGNNQRCTVDSDDVQSIYENYGSPAGYCKAVATNSLTVPVADFNQEALVKCKVGYETSQKKALCQYDSPTSGVFAPSPTCALKENFCAGSQGGLSGLPDGAARFGPAAYGATTTVSCPVGYEPSAPAVCGEDGRFSPAPGCALIPDFCAAVESDPSNLFAASVEASALGETRKVTCPPGFESETATVKCTVGTDGVTPTFSPRGSLVCGAELTKPSDPFTIVVTVENKREVMDSYVTSWFGGLLDDYIVSDDKFTDKVAGKLLETLPDSLSKAGIDCKLEKESVSGLTARMSMQIQGYDSKALLTRAKGEAFADTFLGLHQIFDNLGMPEKYAEIEGKVAAKVKRAMMTKVPAVLVEKMSEQGVKVTVTTEPAVAEAEDDEPAVAPQPDYEMFFRVVVHDRTVLAEHLDSELAKFAVKRMPQSKFLSLIRRQLEEKVVAGVAEKVGDGLAITVTTEADADAGEAAERKSFWLLVKVSAVDIDALLEKTKGRDFADNFNQLLESLQALHLPNSDVLINNIQNSVDTKVMGGIGDALPEKLRESIGAEVWSVPKSGYFTLQAVATEGRCCVGDSDKAVVYWVPAALARGGGALGLGYGREGHCPKIQERTGCVAHGFSQTREAITTSHTSYTDCFNGGGAGGTIGVPTSYVAAECSDE